MNDAPLVSILVLAHNKARFTSRCLEGVLASEYPSVELWLVNNGSVDQTGEIFDRVAIEAEQEKGWRVERIDFPQNVGAIQGRNAALERVSGEFVVFLDNDVVARDPQWLRKLVERIARDETIGAVGPKLVFPKPENTIQCAGCVVTPTGRVDFRGRGRDAGALEYNIEREVQCLISACWIMRRAIIDDVGYLDMAYHPVQFEDIDYCYRMREAGWRVLYDPEVVLAHYENVTTDGTGSINYKYLTIKNGLTFKKRWRHMFRDEGGPADESIKWIEIPHVAWYELDDGAEEPAPDAEAAPPATSEAKDTSPPAGAPAAPAAPTEAPAPPAQAPAPPFEQAAGTMPASGAAPAPAADESAVQAGPPTPRPVSGLPDAASPIPAAASPTAAAGPQAPPPDAVVPVQPVAPSIPAASPEEQAPASVPSPSSSTPPAGEEPEDVDC